MPVSSDREFKDIGKKLRQARKTKRLTLKQVAEQVGCSESMLSKIECERTVPSLRMLHRIASVLETSIGNLFSEESGADIRIYRRGQRPVVVIRDESTNTSIRLERMVPHIDDQIIDGNVHVIAPGASNGGDIKHQGQEVGYVLNGVFELSVGSETFRLHKGDSFFFRSDLPHSYRNVGKEIAKVLWINSPPTF
jgi:transcriptional regulator with XRE-family HTH domain